MPPSVRNRSPPSCGKGADIIAPQIERHAPGLAQLSLTSKFFWIVVIATTGGLLLSISPRVRALKSVGTLIYSHRDYRDENEHHGRVRSTRALLVGLIWMLFHASTMLLLAWLIKAPTFFLAVGSQANVGGAASAPVGVLLAVLGYALGTYGAWLSGLLMRAVAPQ